MKKKFLCLALALAMLLSLVACGGNTDMPANDDQSQDTPADDTNTPDVEPVDDGSLIPFTYDNDEVYDNVLGDFYDAYQKAFEAETVSERYALMAVAEAKMLGAGVMIPLTSRGGQYTLRRNAPKTGSTIMWGSDADRQHGLMPVEEMVTVEDWEAMKALWTELRGTGTYREAARQYLAEHGYTQSDTYNWAYTTDPISFDALATQRQTETRAFVQMVSNLVEYDCENVLQPALAESWEVNDDFTEYTFHIRQGVNWVDNQGRVIAPVTADDWVAGYQHMLDANTDSALTLNLVEGANGYVTGEITDFSQVGVEAVDEYTLVYHLMTPCTYFDGMLTYASVFAPLCRSYYEAHGGQFGLHEFDPSASGYTYATSPETMAYCGPFLLTNHTEKSMLVFKANDAWFNAGTLDINTINWKYNDGSDNTKSYQDFKAGEITAAGLNSATIEIAKADGLYEGYNTISDTDSTSFVGFLNVNRLAFANAADATKMVSTQSEEEAARTHVAMNNQNFRLAFCMALDHGNYNGQVVGEELKLVSLRNSYTPGNFCYLEEEVTIDINGTPTTFPAGSAYGDVMQAQIDADGIPVKVWDPETGLSDGFDGWYNPTAAKEYLDKAVEELAASNCEISAENPIYIDYPYQEDNENYNNRAHAMAQCVEAATDGRIVLNLVGGNAEDWQNAGYYTENGTESNYDMCDVSGWGPDYGDPSTYLDTMLPDGNGYMSKGMGLY